MLRCKNLVAVSAAARKTMNVQYMSAMSGSLSRSLHTANDYKQTEKVQQVVQQILELNVLEMNQLNNIIQTRLGIEVVRRDGAYGGGAAGAAAGGAGPAAAAEPVKEKEDFVIKLGAVDAKSKIKIIKEVRTITGLGLKEAKDLVEKAPVVIKEGVKKEEAEALKKILVEAGALVELI